MVGRWALLLVLAGCGQEPEPSLEVSACRFFEACEPVFALVFPNVDVCVEALLENPEGIESCPASNQAREACIAWLDDVATRDDACVPLSSGPCDALTRCVSCETDILDLAGRCSVGLDIELLLGVCALPTGACVAECLDGQSCVGLEVYPETLLTNCLRTCEDVP